MVVPFNPNQNKKDVKKAAWEKSPGKKLHGFFDKHKLDRRILSANKPYLAKLISITDAAALLGMTKPEAREILLQYNKYPNGYKKKSFYYLVKDIVDVAKRINRPFIIPDGLFYKPELIYVGAGLRQLARVWHDVKTEYYQSVYDLLCDQGVPAQTMIFSAKVVPKLEDSFLNRASSVLAEYNKIAKKDPEKSQKKIVLCTTFGNRAIAEEIVTKYNKKYPGMFIAIDQDHLYRLRERYKQRHQPKKAETTQND